LRCTSLLLSFFSLFLPSSRLHRCPHMAGCLFLSPGARSCTLARMSFTLRIFDVTSITPPSPYSARSLLYCARSLTSGWLPEISGALQAWMAFHLPPRAREIPRGPCRL
jgi:hypothetical protein